MSDERAGFIAELGDGWVPNPNGQGGLLAVPDEVDGEMDVPAALPAGWRDAGAVDDTSEGNGMRYRKKPVEVEAHQWLQNGDHPEDRVGEWETDPLTGEQYQRQEGAVVRYFRRPEPAYAGDEFHDVCGYRWQRHGWIDTLEGGHTVCPKDWVITGVQGERYPCKPDIFDATYEPVETS